MAGGEEKEFGMWSVEPTVTDRREEVPMTNGNKCGIEAKQASLMSN